jgi:DNA-binding transcriptional LysR family regulator
VPNIILVSAQLSVIKNFVKMKAGGAFLMKELLDKEDVHIVGIPFKEKLILNIGLIWRKESQLNNGVLTFIQFLRHERKI